MQARQRRHFVSWFVLHGVCWHALNSQLISLRGSVGGWVPQWQVQHMRRELYNSPWKSQLITPDVQCAAVHALNYVCKARSERHAKGENKWLKEL